MSEHTFDPELAARYASDLHHDLSEGTAPSGGWTEALLVLIEAAIRQHAELATLRAECERLCDELAEAVAQEANAVTKGAAWAAEVMRLREEVDALRADNTQRRYVELATQGNR